LKVESREFVGAKTVVVGCGLVGVAQSASLAGMLQRGRSGYTRPHNFRRYSAIFYENESAHFTTRKKLTEKNSL
jgi:hypothetical protein